MTVKVHVYSQSFPCVMRNVHNTYTKDSLYCVMIGQDGTTVYKFPTQHIFRITEQE